MTHPAPLPACSDCRVCLGWCSGCDMESAVYYCVEVGPALHKTQLDGNCHVDGLVQEIRNSGVLAMELHLSCINPSISTRFICLYLSVLSHCFFYTYQ